MPSPKSSAHTISSTVPLSSGYDMPVLGYGKWKNKDVIAATLAAFEAGYRHIDHAQIYGTETLLGEAIIRSGLDRGELFINTKITSKLNTHGYESALKSVEDSLAKMKLEYIDLFFIHDPFSGPEKRIETYRALLEKQREGKIRSVGVSNYGVKHLEEIIAAGLPLPCVNQIELHPFCQHKPIVEWCNAHGVVLQAYCPLVRGKMDHPVILETTAKYNREPAQVLLGWSLQKGSNLLPKSANPARIKSNTEIFDFELAQKDMERFDALDEGYAGAVSWNPVEVD